MSRSLQGRTKATAVSKIKTTLPFVREPLYNTPVEPRNGSFRDECPNADRFSPIEDAGETFRAFNADYSGPTPIDAIQNNQESREPLALIGNKKRG